MRTRRDEEANAMVKIELRRSRYDRERRDEGNEKEGERCELELGLPVLLQRSTKTD